MSAHGKAYEGTAKRHCLTVPANGSWSLERETAMIGYVELYCLVRHSMKTRRIGRVRHLAAEGSVSRKGQAELKVRMAQESPISC
jgi:hypothetical protein